MLLTIIIFLAVLSVLVFVHELGHFYTARKFGVKASEFGFGFPPRLIGWYKNQGGRWRRVVGNKSVEELEDSPVAGVAPAKGATIYSINWLPIGGFVKIKGENGEGQEENDSFASRSIGRRIIILVAGVTMNVLLAWLLFSVGYMIGLPQSTDSVGRNARVTESYVTVMEVNPDSPASRGGLAPGDMVIGVEGVRIATERALQDAISVRGGQETTLSVRRGNDERTTVVVPENLPGSGQAVIGISIFSSGLVSYPFFSAFWEGAKTTVWVLGQIFSSFAMLFKSLFQGTSVGDQFAGPVGIATITGQAARLGFTYLLQFSALLSLNLAVLNILPFPALDGGRILFLLIEKLKGRPVRKEIEAFIHNAGFLLLIALVLFITYRDIIKLF